MNDLPNENFLDWREEVRVDKLKCASVLLVGDDVVGLEQLQAKLQTLELNLVLTLGGLQGYERAQVSLPDVMLVELEMAGMDGLSLLRLLKSNPLTSDIPVLLITGQSSTKQRLNGFREGAVDVISKPCLAEEVAFRLSVQIEWLRKLKLVQDIRVNQTSALNRSAVSEQEVLVQAIQKHIQDNLSNSPSVAELAEMFGVSERRLASAFKSCLGMSVFAYTRLQRMRRAQYLLANTVLGMEVVAAEVGFSSAANLSTAFHSYCGVTPTGYRTAAHEKAWKDRESALLSRTL